MNKKIKNIILSALTNAAFMGYDKDDDESQEMMEELAEDTTNKILKVFNS